MIAASQIEPVRPSPLDSRTGERREMTLHMGPQHPSMHGVLHLVVGLDGETVKWVDPDIGFLHRGVEKLCETLPWDAIAPVLERNDYLAPSTNSHAFCLAVEGLGGVDVPRRAQWLRCLADELSRISSHLVAWGTMGVDLGGAFGGGTSVFLYCLRERERILDIMQEWTGTRFHPNLSQIGGARYDVPAGFDRLLDTKLSEIDAKLDEMISMMEESPIFQARTRGIGILSPELALGLGACGPVARASGLALDLRKTRPYEAYKEIDVPIVVRTEGDAYARYRVRIDEARVSIRLSRQILAGLPDGPIHGRPPVRSSKHKAPAGTSYAAVEGARGELGVWIRSDKEMSPTRVRLRSPSFANLSAIVYILPGHLIADVVAVLGSLDPVFGDVDR